MHRGKCGRAEAIERWIDEIGIAAGGERSEFRVCSGGAGRESRQRGAAALGRDRAAARLDGIAGSDSHFRGRHGRK